MPRTRDPFPFPRYNNDHDFTGIQRSQKLIFKKPTHMAQNEEPWSRLTYTATLSSMRKSALHYDNETPKDSLDLHLKAVYDNHLDFLKNKNQILIQKETLVDHGEKKADEEPNYDPHKELRVWVNPQKASIHSIEGTIESHHNASTNRGYSRKHDGGFYSA
ncbi:cilia- and flagella-associated protein 276 [Hoplias malabaricus]|uniref:cilia- and flagella-associated protein 276 n=1 Tax=Hoplias malabaricus TaxID=27720 RepID=UPI003462488C